MATHVARPLAEAECPRLRLRAEGKKSPELEPRRGQKRESTHPLPDLEEEVTSTVPVESGPAPIQGGSSSSADVPVNSST